MPLAGPAWVRAGSPCGAVRKKAPAGLFPRPPPDWPVPAWTPA